MRCRIISERNRFYVEYRRFFIWRRLQSLVGWWSASTLEEAIEKVTELNQPDQPRRVIYLSGIWRTKT